MEKRTAAAKNPLVLAFIGDAVWTLMIREKIVRAEDAKVGELHKLTSAKVSAVSQSELFEKLKGGFDEAEQDIARRARNAHNNTVPKNCELADYKRATALEAVIGYNYLIGNQPRIQKFLEGLC